MINGNRVREISGSIRFAFWLSTMDIMMPDMNRIEATRRILGEHAGLHDIMLTMLEDDDSLFTAMRAGARGYILKGKE